MWLRSGSQGDYGLRLTARGMAGEELMCLDVAFQLAFPSGNKQ